MPVHDCVDSLLDSLVETFSPETAQRIAALRAPEEINARVALLAEKANHGTLTAEEAAEYEAITDLLFYIGIVQVKVREMSS